MKIQEMFKNDINRKINGVVQVAQYETEILKQELDEYVITRELKKHFTTFFNSYTETFNQSTQDIGVWISGFFGSGKSHFLKILSYLLENKEIDGIRTVERFRNKFEDPGTFMSIEKAVEGETETILFNIGAHSEDQKNTESVVRVFAKMFYKHLGFYGDDLKVVELEKYVEKKGKTEEFCRVFEEKSGQSWLESRETFAFSEDYIIETMQQVFGMSEKSAENWFNGEEKTDLSANKLVSEINDYVSKKPKNYRLLFMVDEIGQYIGADLNHLLNLQSLVEEIGSKCRGKVWVICTGQEALDEVIRTRQDEFSKIQARFPVRLLLASTSADEVIQKRLLDKTTEAYEKLKELYEDKEQIIKNLLRFNKDDAVSDIKGFDNSREFAKNFPFIPYQFLLMQQVFTKIREHGHAGKHLSDGERSMLNGFQNAVKKIEDKDEHSLVPFYLFYDTIHGFLDSSVRRAIERCEQIVEKNLGLEPQDVNVLKSLYLIRYLDDVKATVDSIVILMADDIRTDKVSLRNQVEASLGRLLKQNCIGRTGNTYHFLTNAEQDIAKDIRNTRVDTSKVSKQIGETIFCEIFTDKKFRYKDQNFSIGKSIDETTLESNLGGMEFHIYSVATNKSSENELYLLRDSYHKAILVLGNDKYYENYMNALKIEKYIEPKNVAQLPKSTQDIISKQRENEELHKEEGRKELEEAIINGKFYVDGENVTEKLSKGITAKNKIYQVLEKLFQRIYSKFDYVKEHYETNQDISDILNEKHKTIDGLNPNEEAIDEVKDFISRKAKQNLRISMEEIQGEYRKAPYGWAEVDIVALIATLISEQKVTAKYSGKTISLEDPKLLDMLMKKGERGKTIISERQSLNPKKLGEVIKFLRDYLNEMNVPKDEDGLIKFIAEKFEWLKRDYEQLNDKYKGKKYPDKEVVEDAIKIVDEVLSQQNEPVALIDKLITLEGDLHYVKKSLEKVESFFKNKVKIFDEALAYTELIQTDIDYVNAYQDAKQALDEIQKIIQIVPDQKFAYDRIPELHDLIKTIKQVHNELLQQKRQKVLDVIQSCMKSIHEKAVQDSNAKKISDESDCYFDQKKKGLNNCKTISKLQSIEYQIWEKHDEVLQKIDEAISPKSPGTVKKTYKKIARQEIFPAKTLQSEAEIDEYVESIREKMKRYLKENNGFEIS